MANNSNLDPNLDPQEIQEEISIITSAFRDASDEIISRIKAVNKTAGTTLDSTLKNITKQVGIINQAYNNINAGIGEGIKGETKRKTILNEINKVKKADRTISAELRVLEIQIAKASGAKKKSLQDISDILIEQKADLQDINELHERELELADKFLREKLQPLAGILQGLKKIPIIGNIINPDRGVEKMTKAAQGGAGTIKTFAVGLKGTFEGILGIAARLTLLVGVFGAIVKIAKFFVDSMFGADKQITNLAKNLGVSKVEASAIRDSFSKMSSDVKNIYFTIEHMVEAQTDLNDKLGISAIFTRDILENQIILTKQYGLSADEAARINQLAIVSGKDANKTRISILQQNANLFKQTGILLNSKKVIQDVAKIQGQLSVQYKNNPDLIAKAVVQTQKLGLNLEQAAKISDSLLDFQSSIANELEAELLTGKELHLNRAANLALQGKSAEAAEDLVKQFGTLKDFQKLNVLQQRSLAKAIGLSADELSNALVEQEKLKGAAGAQVKALMEAGKVEQANALKKRIISGESLDAALKEVTAQEKFEQSMNKVKEIFSRLVDGDTLNKLADILSDIVNTLSSYFGTSASDESKSVLKNIKANKNLSTTEQAAAINIQDKIKQNDGFFRKGFGRIVGEMFGGPGMAMLNNVKDIEDKINLEKLQSINQPQQDFISRGDKITPFRKDDIIIGGTSLDKNNNKEVIGLLKMINDQLSKGGDIYMDSQKVGTAIVRGSNKVA